MLSSFQQGLIVETLSTHGFLLTNFDERHIELENRYDGNSLTIYIIIDTPQPFLSVRLNGEKIFGKISEDFPEFEKSIEDFLNNHFKED